MKELKRRFWREWLKVMAGKIPYILLSYIIYPFINRTKTREKHYSGKGGWWNRQLWYMLNDDELKRYETDWDPKQVAEKGIDTSTRFGRFKASYWFNVIRNKAYNYSLTFDPIHPKEYKVSEKEIDEIYKLGEKINPLEWAEWKWITKDGRVTNKGSKLSIEHSKAGTGKVWFHPDNIETILYCRYSWAKKYKIFKWDLYQTFQIGAWSGKYDIQFKNKIIKR